PLPYGRSAVPDPNRANDIDPVRRPFPSAQRSFNPSGEHGEPRQLRRWTQPGRLEWINASLAVAAPPGARSTVRGDVSPAQVWMQARNAS
ncbi:hypothetical protein, partial [Caballeronia sp. dw_19]|uniref:hypothetical protein n=1 Tax=Caballeronia sp. dw_19 TaxID=2719791 RepID=UPI001BD309B7